jgi:aminoglycoside phosphotransferase (APT) family kinase protein
MLREHRVVSALEPTPVPVTPILGLCRDKSVNGATFYVMEWVSGIVLNSADRAEVLPQSYRASASDNLIDVLADLHSVDIDQIGLGDLGRREGYVERQLRRWTKQWNDSKTREVPAVEEVALRLAQEVPQQLRSSITHGDYRFGNCLIDGNSGRVAAVLDWELCALGEPLADLGYLGVFWNDRATGHALLSDPTSAGGFRSYSDLLERYACRTGQNLDNIGYFVAFSSWRLAVIAEGVYARYLSGAMGDQEIDLVDAKARVERLADHALSWIPA